MFLVVGMKLHTKAFVEGHSETILFIPGLTGSHEAWDEYFKSLQQSFRLVMIDTLGFGHSPKPDIAYTLDDHINAINDTLQALGVSRVHIVGHSMGAILAVAYAFCFPARVEKLALLALPWFHSEQEAREHIGQGSWFYRLLAMDTPLAHIACLTMCALRPILLPLIPLVVRDVPPMVAQDALRHTWTSYSRSLQNIIFRAETTKWIRELTHPILFIHGRQDKVAPLANVQAGLSNLPQAKLLELEADHGLIFTHSQVITESIRDMLLT